MQEMDTADGVDLRHIVPTKQSQKKTDAEQLGDLMEKMQITVVGKEQGHDSDNDIESDSDD